MKEKLRKILYEADTFWGKAFDIALLLAILLSVFSVMLESVESLDAKYHVLFEVIEWTFTIAFTLEYIARLSTVDKAHKYAFSFFGIIDLLSTIPTYLALVFSGAQSMLILRSIRLLRVFRVFKLVRFTGGANQLSAALKASQAKITVFVGAIFIIVMIMGTAMYLIEGGDNGFTSIPRSVYWAIVTLTTVGYGDIAPQTVLGQSLASIIMIMGYGIIAVPTGIVTSELTKAQYKTNTKACSNCSKEGHENDSAYCKYCGEQLDPEISKTSG